MRLRNIPTSRQELADSSYVLDEALLPGLRGRWAGVFGNDHPIHIEIGMGKGQFLLALARREPEVNFIGIERYSSVLVHPVRKLNLLALQDDSGQSADIVKPASDSGSLASVDTGQDAFLTDSVNAPELAASLPMQNLRLLRMDAELLTEVFAPGEVDRIYLNFSDPWPKDRHAKRRLPGRVFLKRYEQVLSAAGQVEFKTDNRALFDFALEEAQAAGWTVRQYTYDLHHDPVMMEGNIMTEYEQKFSALGNPICRLVEAPAAVTIHSQCH